MADTASKCRVCGKKRKLNEEGMCGKCFEESGGLLEEEGGDEECATPPADVLKQIQQELDADKGAGETKAPTAKEDTMFGEKLGLPAIPKHIATKFHKRLPKDELTPGNPELLAVATTPEAKDKLMVQANNGRRLLRVETKEAKGSTYYGVYAY